MSIGVRDTSRSLHGRIIVLLEAAVQQRSCMSLLGGHELLACLSCGRWVGCGMFRPASIREVAAGSRSERRGGRLFCVLSCSSLCHAITCEILPPCLPLPATDPLLDIFHFWVRRIRLRLILNLPTLVGGDLRV